MAKMTLRQQSAKWCRMFKVLNIYVVKYICTMFYLDFECHSVSTHSLILFDDGSTSVVPVKAIIGWPWTLKVAENVEVHWSDKRIYEATIQALGQNNIFIIACVYTIFEKRSQKEMNGLADALEDYSASQHERKVSKPA